MDVPEKHECTITTFAVMRPAPPPPRDETSHYFDKAAELKRRFPNRTQVNCTTLMYRAGWVGGLSKEHALKVFAPKRRRTQNLNACRRRPSHPPNTQACDPHTATLCSSRQSLTIHRSPDFCIFHDLFVVANNQTWNTYREAQKAVCVMVTGAVTQTFFLQHSSAK